jgi:hypothetical protein
MCEQCAHEVIQLHERSVTASYLALRARNLRRV